MEEDDLLANICHPINEFSDDNKLVHITDVEKSQCK